MVFCLPGIMATLLAATAGKRNADTPTPSGSAGAPVDFVRDIQPVLAEHCYSCHGPEKQKSGLRLDRQADALRGGDTGKAIVPGRSSESLLFKYVAGLDPEKVMPPRK